MKEGGFQLCKWESNNKQVCQSLMQSSQQDTNVNSDRSDEIRKVLGVNWIPEKDYLHFDFKELVSLFRSLTKVTKQNVLKIAAMFFDPLGLIALIVLQPKLLFKSLCMQNLDWDE